MSVSANVCAGAAIHMHVCGPAQYPSTESFYLFIESGVVIGLEPSEPDYDQ